MSRDDLVMARFCFIVATIDYIKAKLTPRGLMKAKKDERLSGNGWEAFLKYRNTVAGEI